MKPSIKRHLSILAAVLLLCLTAACSGETEDPDGVSCSDLMLTSSNGLWANGMWANGLWHNGLWNNGMWSNGLWMNGLWQNGLWVNGMWSNGIWSNGLWSNGLWQNGLWQNGLQDSHIRQLLEYTVSCALAPGQELRVEVDGETQVFPGEVGLAPEWAEGPCDETCKGWVSACLIARVNAKGQHRMISMRGDHPALAVSQREAAIFTRPEATYFGDVSTDPPRLHACLPDGATGISRVCGESLDNCFLDVAGYCSDVCKDGICRDTNGETYAQTISVYIPSEDLANRCVY